MPNEKQKEYWNDDAGPKWVKHQDRLDRMLGQVTQLLLGKIAVKPGEALLEIGCGTGEVAALLTESGAKVTGIDLSEPMVASAKARGATGAEFLVADASLYRGSAPFDIAASRFGVMFFDDPVGAFSNIRGNIAGGGRMVFVCWRGPEYNPWALVPALAVKPFLPEAEPADPEAPGPFAFADDARLRGILENAGFADVVIDANEVEISLSEGGGLDDATDFACQIGPAARAMSELDDDARIKARAAVREALAGHIADDGQVVMAGAVWLVSASA